MATLSDERIPEEQERLRRWRLMLGTGVNQSLNQRDHEIDRTLTALYGRGGGKGSGIRTQALGRARRSGNRGKGDSRDGGMEDSAPTVSRWLGDIRNYFPDSVVQVMQQDAIRQIGLSNLLLEPDILEEIQPDVTLVTSLLSLKDAIPGQTKASARILVKKVVDDLMRRLENPMREAIRGALNRAQRNFRPRLPEINWHHTIKANLKNYQQDINTVIPERLIGYGRKRRTNKHEIIICVDQSGSMASSVVYSSVFGAVMASITAIKTSMVLFDTSVVDMTADLDDPVDILFGAQLGGGTDINRALGYCQRLISRPADTTLILITDLYEGGSYQHMMLRVKEILAGGSQLVVLLALSDEGAPGYNHQAATDLAELGVAAFACTPDLFPELMAAVLNGKDLGRWASQHELVV
ncbi:MAG: VWA domain-containing protein [Chloroflexota bacterium]